LALRSRVVADASNALAAALRITRRAPAFTIAISAFATGVVVGGSAVWLSGASRHAGVDPTARAASGCRLASAAVTRRNRAHTISCRHCSPGI
jgi:hypothetical protein